MIHTISTWLNSQRLCWVPSTWQLCLEGQYVILMQAFQVTERDESSSALENTTYEMEMRCDLLIPKWAPQGESLMPHLLGAEVQNMWRGLTAFRKVQGGRATGVPAAKAS
jgi:hypothetical protein